MGRVIRPLSATWRRYDQSNVVIMRRILEITLADFARNLSGNYVVFGTIL
jgi:hypothetical protein